MAKWCVSLDLSIFLSLFSHFLLLSCLVSFLSGVCEFWNDVPICTSRASRGEGGGRDSTFSMIYYLQSLKDRIGGGRVTESQKGSYC
jgi:hypothetical protein